MKKLSNQRGRHAAKHLRRAATLDGEDVMIEFSPDVLQAMNEFCALVRDKPEHVDADVTHILESIASGEPVSVPDALMSLMLVSEKAGECCAKVSDWDVSAALRRIRTALGDFRNSDAQAVTVAVGPKKKSR